jgi:hypothetical protein
MRKSMAFLMFAVLGQKVKKVSCPQSSYSEPSTNVLHREVEKYISRPEIIFPAHWS